MDICKKKEKSMEEVARQPLVPSEKNNAAPNVRKIRPREAVSRYKAGNTATAATQRHPSPSAPRATPVSPSPLPKRAQSAERKRPSTPQTRSSAPSSPSSKPSTRPSSPSRPSTPVRDTMVASLQLSSHKTSAPRAPDGLWPSIRSLSASFQSESISIPIAKRDKPATSSMSSSKDHILNCSVSVTPERKRTPLRGRNTSDCSENLKTVMDTTHSRVVDQHRWPGMIGRNLAGSVTSRSMDLTVVASRGVSPRRRTMDSDGPAGVLKKSTSDGTRRMSSDGIGREESETSAHHNASPNVRERASSLTRASRSMSLPAPAPLRPSSPNKVTSPTAASSRGMASPSRSRPSSPYSPSSSTSGRASISSSVLSYISDARKVKRNASNVEDVHQLRLSYNRYLQWRFVNAIADEASLVQKIRMEEFISSVLNQEDLHSTWETITALRDSVVSKKMKMQHLKQELKLNSILEEQMLYLEDWTLLERDHLGSLEAAVEALRASTLRLPVSGGARADTKSLKDAINAAIDIMGSMGSSICCMLSKVEGTNSLISELANLAADETFMLEHCRELLSSTAAMQVQESSLRTHLLQLNQHMNSEVLTRPV